MRCFAMTVQTPAIVLVNSNQGRQIHRLLGFERDKWSGKILLLV
jgi:hypothetical protein